MLLNQQILYVEERIHGHGGTPLARLHTGTDSSEITLGPIDPSVA